MDGSWSENEAEIKPLKGRHDIQNKDIQHNDIQNKDIQHKDIQHNDTQNINK